MIIALSGRRVDAADAGQLRFPSSNVNRVREALRGFFQEHRATCLVSSAACGADLLALSEAGQLGIRRRIVIPFGRQKFRQTSVVDRPGDWGRLYDSIMDQVESTGDVLVLDSQVSKNEDEQQAYKDANHAILSEAMSQAPSADEPITALLVWEGKSRGKDDFTHGFGEEARRLGLTVREILTV